MATVDKNVLIRKKSGSDILNIYPQTKSTIVKHIKSDGFTETTVGALLNSVDDRFGTFSTPAGGSQNTTVMEEIAYQVNEAKKQILGVDNQSSIQSAYDTIVELANILGGTEASYSEVTPEGTENPSEEGWFEDVAGDYVATSDTSVQGGKTYYQNDAAAVAGLISKVNTLMTEVETATTGLLDRTTALERSVDGWTDNSGAEPVVHAGLLDRVTALENFAATGATLHVLESTATDSDITNENDLYFVELA